MSRVIILLAVGAIGLILWYKISNSSGAKRKKLIISTAVGASIAVLLGLAFTGHLNWITATIGAIIAMVPKLMNIAKYIPVLNRFRQPPPEQPSHQARNSKNGMSKQQAYEVLGIKAGAGKDEIIAAHRRMMQKVHPDRGGSDYLAAQLNKAKDTLLG